MKSWILIFFFNQLIIVQTITNKLMKELTLNYYQLSVQGLPINYCYHDLVASYNCLANEFIWRSHNSNWKLPMLSYVLGQTVINVYERIYNFTITCKVLVKELNCKCPQLLLLRLITSPLGHKFRIKNAVTSLGSSVYLLLVTYNLNDINS